MIGRSPRRHGASIVALFILGGLLAPGQAQAQYPNLPRLEVAPFVGWRFGGTLYDKQTGRTFRLEPNWSHGLTVDIPVADDFRVEFRYTRQRTFVEVPARDTSQSGIEHLGLNVDNYQATGLLDWGYGRAKPYIFVGLGLTHLRVESGGSTEALRPAMNSGIGTKVRLSDHFGLRIEFRGQVTFVSTNASLWCNPVCNLGWSSNGLWQGEASAGVNFRL